MQKVNGRYRVQYWLAGKKKSETFSKMRDATAFEQKITRERELIRAGLELPKDSVLLLDYAGKYLRKRFLNKKHSTASTEERNIKWFTEALGLKPVRAISTKDIREFLDEIQAEREWGPATRNRMRAYLNIMFQQAFMDEEIMVNPISRIPVEKETPAKKIPLTLEEAERFIDVAANPMRKLFAILLVYQGPRVSEVMALEHPDFDIARGFLHFRRIWEQSSGEVHERLKGKPEGIVVPLLPIVAHAYRDYVSEYGRKTDRLFLNEEGKPASVYTGKNWVASMRELAKIEKKLSPHVLRATFASLAEEKGMPREVVQKLMGHSTITMTARYVTRRDEEIKNRVLGSGFGEVLDSSKVIKMRGKKHAKSE